MKTEQMVIGKQVVARKFRPMKEKKRMFKGNFKKKERLDYFFYLIVFLLYIFGGHRIHILKKNLESLNQTLQHTYSSNNVTFVEFKNE